MKREVIERLAGQVVVGEHFGGVDDVLAGVVLRVDLVMDDALRQGRRELMARVVSGIETGPGAVDIIARGFARIGAWGKPQSRFFG